MAVWKHTDVSSTVPDQPDSSHWLVLKSKHRVWINEIKLYIFCEKYKESNMRRNKVGAFEIYFVTDEGTCPKPLPSLLRVHRLVEGQNKNSHQAVQGGLLPAVIPRASE